MSDSTEQAKKPVVEALEDDKAGGKERTDLTDAHDGERAADAEQADDEGTAGG